MISLLHPSRSRPQQAYNTAKKWIENAGVEIEYILSLDVDDPLEREYWHWFANRMQQRLVSENRSAIDAINKAAKNSKCNILVQMADDFDCPPLWGKQIIEATQGKTDWILKTPDGIQKWIITLPIMDRAYYNRFGYIYFPEYRHMFCDTELTCVADLTGRKIEANITFVHNHYSTGKTKKDEVNERADATWKQGEELFIKRAKENFGLVNPIGKIQSQEYLNWIKMKMR